VSATPTYHDDDWLRNLARGQAGAAFFRWWFDKKVAPRLGGRGILLHTGFDDDRPISAKRFLAEGQNPPDFCLLRTHGDAVAGNVIASFSVNSQAAPYTMHSGALTEGCFGCPAQRPCFERDSPRVWINVAHMRDSWLAEETLDAPDYRVILFVRQAARFNKAIVDQHLEQSLERYLNSGIATIADPTHKQIFECLDELGYARTKKGNGRGRHEPELIWFPSDAPFFHEASRKHWRTKVKARASTRAIHCIHVRNAQLERALIREIVQRVDAAFS